MADCPLTNRELSWLSFNERVLQEAEDTDVPLFERLKFLAIFSSNLDEFFRVRVASHRSLLALSAKRRKKLDFDVAELLDQVHERSLDLQERFGRTFRDDVLPGLADRGLGLIADDELTAEQATFMEEYFEGEVRPHVEPTFLDDPHVFLKDHTVYLVVELGAGPVVDGRGGGRHEFGPARSRIGLVEVPSPPLPRFLKMPQGPDGRCVIFLDDVIRRSLHKIFPDAELLGAYAVKISRDADLHLDDEFAGQLKDAIRRALGRRDTGDPIRFLYDLHMPTGILTRLQRTLGLRYEDLMEGGRYHNLHDLMSYPLPDGAEDRDDPLPPLPHPALAGAQSILDAAAERDHLLHFPYQAYDPVLRFLDESADDPAVEDIWISLYRIGSDSAVARSLIRAAQAGRKVTAFIEVQARFDEDRNLRWAERMEEAGVRTIYPVAGIKVHAKLALVRRREPDGSKLYAYLATGNFNEKTATLYADHGLLTCDRRLTEEVLRVFEGLKDGPGAREPQGPETGFAHLLVAPHHLRKRLYALIDAEIEAAERGDAAGITAKMNSLEDPGMIRRLCRASRAGVPVSLTIRGICCLVPGVPGATDGICARSIVDRFLEHSRIWHFHAGGEDKLYLASADWMRRNLKRRVEVAFPLYDEAVRNEIFEVLRLQEADAAKARSLLADHENERIEEGDAAPIRCQIETYRFLEGLLQEA